MTILFMSEHSLLVLWPYVQKLISLKHQNLDNEINFMSHCHGRVLDNTCNHLQHQMKDDVGYIILKYVYDTSNPYPIVLLLSN